MPLRWTLPLLLLAASLPLPASAGEFSWDAIVGTWEVAFDNDRDHVTEGVLIEVTASGATDAQGDPTYTGVVADGRWHDCFRDGTVLFEGLARDRQRGASVGIYEAEGGVDGDCAEAQARVLLDLREEPTLRVERLGGVWLGYEPGTRTPRPDRVRGVYTSLRTPQITIEISGQAPRYVGVVTAAGEGSCLAVGDQVLPDILFGRGVAGVAGNYRSDGATWGVEECVPGSTVALNLIEGADGEVARLDVGRDQSFADRNHSFTRVGDLPVDAPPPTEALPRPVEPNLTRFRGHYGGILGGTSSEVRVGADDTMTLVVRGSPCVAEAVVAVLSDARATADAVVARAEFNPIGVEPDCEPLDLGTTSVRLSDLVEFGSYEDDERQQWQDALLLIDAEPDVSVDLRARRRLNAFDLVVDQPRPDGTIDRASHAVRVDAFIRGLLLSGGGGFAQARTRPVYFGTLGAFPDGLALAGVAGATGGLTVLLDPEDGALNQALLDSIAVPASEYVIAGGQAALSDAVLPDLPSDIPIRRIAGSNRFATAAALSAQSFGPGAPVVYVATGGNFPDALSGGAQASRDGAPILLVDGSRMPMETDAELRRLAPGRIVILGGEAVVPADMAERLADYAPEVVRLAGPTRFDTAVAISRASAGASRGVVLTAPGGDYPDALVLASLGWLFDGPLLLLPGGAVPASVLDELGRLAPSSLQHLGPRLPDEALGALLSVLPEGDAS